MGLISRPAKEGGAFSYVAKVALGFTKILAVEADADHDTIYNEFNGNITNANIADAAGILRSKLILTGGILTADLADRAVTGPKIALLAILKEHVAALGAGVGNVTGGLSFGSPANAETTLASVVITTKGGPVALVGGGVRLSVQVTGASPAGTLIWRWYRDGTPIGLFADNLNGVTGSFVRVPVPGPSMIDTAPSAAAHTYALSVQTGGTAQITASTAALGAGSIYAKEHLA
jgi:hypothetical protein